jgi:ABC-type glycerol-3-phosphate transport system permease component
VMKALRTLKQFPIHVVMVALSLIALYPVYYMTVTAMKSREEYFKNPYGLPWAISFANLGDLISHGLMRQVGNTALITLISCVIGITISILAAYPFARMKFRGQTVLFNVIIALLAMPGVVVVVPLYGIMASLHLLNTYLGISLVYAGFMFPLSVFVLTSFFKTVPGEIIDAACIDGCGDFQTLLRIVLPMSRPSLVTLSIVNALGVWNEFLVALLFMQKNELRTVVVAIAMMQDKYQVNIPSMGAASLFVGLPVMIAYIFGQKYFVKGLATGAVK